MGNMAEKEEDEALGAIDSGVSADDHDDLAAGVSKLAISDGKDDDDDDDKVQLRIQDVPDAPVALKTLAYWILSGQCKNIVILNGAGVSVAAGIPDFRTPGTGLYDNLQKYNLPYPEAVFDVGFYRKNPQPFCSLAKEIWPGTIHSPTLTHSFLSLLAKHDRLLRVYTQNIDGLEVLAGLEADKIVECHGHFRTASCIRCGAKTPADEMDAIVKSITVDGKVPICGKCNGGYIKPDIVFFGEGLPDRFHRLLKPDLRQADLLIILGTSLQVAPVSMIPDMVDRRICKRVLLNRELVGNLDIAGRKNKLNKQLQQDIFHKGDCDDSIVTLAKLMGWYDELIELNTQTRVGKNKKTKNDNNNKKDTN